MTSELQIAIDELVQANSAMRESHPDYPLVVSIEAETRFETAMRSVIVALAKAKEQRELARWRQELEAIADFDDHRVAGRDIRRIRRIGGTARFRVNGKGRYTIPELLALFVE